MRQLPFERRQAVPPSPHHTPLHPPTNLPTYPHPPTTTAECYPGAVVHP